MAASATCGGFSQWSRKLRRGAGKNRRSSASTSAARSLSDWLDRRVDRSAGQAAAVAYRAIGGREAHARIVGDLLVDAVETDRTSAKPGHAGVPHRLAVALAAKLRMADVEADETEGVAIGDGGDSGDHLAAHECAEKPFRVRRMERRRIVEPRVPAFAGRPVHQRHDFAGSQHTDIAIAGHPVPSFRLRKNGRSGGIRTHDPLTPSQVRYRAALHSGPGADV